MRTNDWTTARARTFFREKILPVTPPRFKAQAWKAFLRSLVDLGVLATETAETEGNRGP